MANGAQQPFSEQALELYQSVYYERCDLVYRLGVILTASRDGAERLTEATYRSLLEDFDQVKPYTDATEHLLTLAWKSWQKVKAEKFHDWNHPAVKSLGKLSLIERLVLYAVDMAGVSVANCAKIFEVTQQEAREALAAARRRVARGEIQV